MAEIKWRYEGDDTFFENGAAPAQPPGKTVLGPILAREGRKRSGTVTLDQFRRVTVTRFRNPPTTIHLAGAPINSAHAARLAASHLANPVQPVRSSIEKQVSGEDVDDLQLALLWAAAIRARLIETRHG